MISRARDNILYKLTPFARAALYNMLLLIPLIKVNIMLNNIIYLISFNSLLLGLLYRLSRLYIYYKRYKAY
jgi:hypothetical protein